MILNLKSGLKRRQSPAFPFHEARGSTEATADPSPLVGERGDDRPTRPIIAIHPLPRKRANQGRAHAIRAWA